MKRFFFLAFMGLCSCGPTTNSPQQVKFDETPITDNKDKDLMAKNALAFINAYVENCNKMGNDVGVAEWVLTSRLDRI